MHVYVLVSDVLRGNKSVIIHRELRKTAEQGIMWWPWVYCTGWSDL